MSKLNFNNTSIYSNIIIDVRTHNNVKIGELFVLEDGYYVFEVNKNRGGVLTQHDLKQIHNKLEELNTPQDNNVSLYFALEKVGLPDWLTKGIGKLVLAELEKTDFNIEWFVGHLQQLKESNYIEIVDDFTPTGERLAGVVIDNNTKHIMTFHCDKKTLREALIEIGVDE